MSILLAVATWLSFAFYTAGAIGGVFYLVRFIDYKISQYRAEFNYDPWADEVQPSATIIPMPTREAPISARTK